MLKENNYAFPDACMCLSDNRSRGFVNAISQEPPIRISCDSVCRHLPARPQNEKIWSHFRDLKNNGGHFLF